jgi:hypothetical protein
MHLINACIFYGFSFSVKFLWKPICIIVTGRVMGCRNTACVRAETQSGGTALMYAAASGRTECVRLLLEDGANQEALNNVRFVPSIALFMFVCCIAG